MDLNNLLNTQTSCTWIIYGQRRVALLAVSILI